MYCKTYLVTKSLIYNLITYVLYDQIILVNFKTEFMLTLCRWCIWLSSACTTKFCPFPPICIGFLARAFEQHCLNFCPNFTITTFERFVKRLISVALHPVDQRYIAYTKSDNEICHHSSNIVSLRSLLTALHGRLHLLCKVNLYNRLRRRLYSGL